MTSHYFLDNSWDQARQRLALLHEIHDPATFRRLEATGVGPGWSVFVPGGGGGSIVSWLADRVGLQGRVLSTDIDTRFLDEITAPNVEVRRHDIAVDAIPEGAFDLVAVRLLLIHVPARDVVLGRLVAALKPGGRILIEEYDLFPAAASPEPSWAALSELAIPALRAGGSDYAWARSMPARLAAAGLEDIKADVDAPFFRGGSQVAAFHWLTGEQGRPLMADMPPEARALFDASQAALRDPERWFLPPAMVAVTGRANVAVDGVLEDPG